MRQRDQVQVAFGTQVREVRIRLGMSIEDLAEHAALDPSYVGQVERGTRNLSLFNVWRLACGLKVPAAELVSTLPPLTKLD